MSNKSVARARKNCAGGSEMRRLTKDEQALFAIIANPQFNAMRILLTTDVLDQEARNAGYIAGEESSSDEGLKHAELGGNTE